MTIVRTINGEQHKIELTPEELHDAYREQEKEYDTVSAEEYLDEEMESYLERCPGSTEEQIMALVPQLTEAYREQEDSDSFHWREVMSDVADDVFRAAGFELEDD